MRLTKTDMARVVVTALYNMKSLAPADHPQVVRKVRALTADQLKYEHKLALAVIESARPMVKL
jgi:hypothetical protein